MSLAKIEENVTIQNCTDDDDDVKSEILKEDIGSPFEILNTVYV